MRQCTERHIERDLAPVETIDRDQLRQWKRRELREYIAHRLAGAAFSRKQGDLGARVAQQHAHQLAPGITRGSQDADLRFRGHDSILIQKS